MRIVALTVFVLALGACAGKLPAHSGPRAEVAPLPDPPMPEGWWVETSDGVNPSDVGSGAHFTPEGAILVLPGGSVDRAALRLRKVAPHRWDVDLDGNQMTVQQTAADALVVETRGKRIVFRPATASEALGFEARAAARD
jgi:hypothetical protein